MMTPKKTLSNTDRVLKLYLYFIGVAALFAFAAVIMPARWMIEISEQLGIEIGPVPLTFYLARHLSLIYGLVGVAVLVVARRLPADRWLARLLAWLTLGLGVGHAILDLQSGMPSWWTVREAAFSVTGGIILLVLSRENRTPSSGSE
jgi:hypothetical protein